MSRDRQAILRVSIGQRLLDATRHLKTLEHAASRFGGDFDLEPFEVAWQSEDAVELEQAYAVQAGYENVINACIKISQELCELEGWSTAGVAPSSVEALKLLHERGVITASTRVALKEAQERRSAVQHDYINVEARDIHAAARHVLEHAPLLLQDVAGALRHAQ